MLLFGGLTFAWRYFSEYFSGIVESHLMSVVDVRPDDECYNFLMAWVANQRFSQGARRFVVNTNLNSVSLRIHPNGINLGMEITWLTLSAALVVPVCVTPIVYPLLWPPRQCSLASELLCFKNEWRG